MISPQDIEAIANAVAAKLGGSARKAEYTRQEFAALVGVSPDYLKKRHVYQRYGGKCRGGKIIFPEKSRLALEAGRSPLT